MGKRYYADIAVNVRVFFDDNGLDDLKDQAVEAVDCLIGLTYREGELEDNGLEIQGEPTPVMEADRAE